MQENRSTLPSADRIGVLVASVLLAFAMTRLIQAPSFTITLELPGFYFALPLTLGTFMTILAAALTAAGMDWLTRFHPALGSKTNIEHLMLPTITTFVIGAPLSLLPNGIACGQDLRLARLCWLLFSRQSTSPLTHPLQPMLWRVPV
ncbi:MAG: hypothetical protein IPL27_23555 [Lewinellaceae bacterium]|nr:hypothetical protein [Lewinellaceae bacterium]